MVAEALRMRELLALSLRASEPERGQAEQELQALQQQPLSARFLAAVLEISVAVPGADGEPANLAALAQLDADARLLAVLWVKHFLKRQWKARGNQLTDDERAHVRQVLLFAAVREPSETIALHLALVLAQIARSDFPGQWKTDELFPPLLAGLVDGPRDVAVEKRHVDVLYRIVKELSTRRLMVHRKQFAALGVEMLPLVMQYWKALATRTAEFMWTQCRELSVAAADPNVAMQIKEAMGSTGTSYLATELRAIKLLSTVLLNAYRDLASLQNGELIRTTLVDFYTQLENLSKLRQALVTCTDNRGDGDAIIAVVALVDKCMHRAAGIVVGLQNSYPIEFREYLPPYLAIFWQTLTTSPPTAVTLAFPAPERLQIAALQFFANVLSCRLYKNESLSSTMGSSRIITKVITASGDVELSDAMVMDAQSAVDTFFSSVSENRFETLLSLVVTRFMTLTPKDLEEWQNDPEGFCIAGESMTAEESVRACAENLFLTLLQNFPQQTIPGLTQMTSHASAFLQESFRQGSSAAVDEQRIIDTDAVLLAIGLGCYDLHECFEFEPWFLANLVPILASGDTGMGSVRGLPVLRFRIVWLVSCWLAQLSANVRPPLYDVILSASLFVPNGDTALKLRVVQTLESMVNDWGFERDAFAPFLSRGLHCLYSFFPEAEETDSKMKILSCLEAIVQACGSSIAPYFEAIASPLPPMWAEESEASNLVRGKILQLLSKLLSTATTDDEQEISVSAAASSSIVALVGMCLQVIRFATDISNPDEVFLMESGLELWRSSLSVSQSYTEELHMLFGNIVQLMQRDFEHIKIVLEILTLYLRKGGSQFWETYHLVVGSILTSVIGSVRAEASHQVADVTELVLAAFPIEQIESMIPIVKAMAMSCAAFAHKDEQREPDGVIASYLSVTALLIVRSLDVAMVQVLENDQGLLMIVEIMLKLYYTVGSSPLTATRRKVWALALCASLSMVTESMLEKTGEILEVCVDVMEQEREDAESAANDADGTDAQDGKRGVFRAYQSHRAQQQRGDTELEAAVRDASIKTVACARLSVISQQLGAASFEQLLTSVDSSVLRQLQS